MTEQTTTTSAPESYSERQQRIHMALETLAACIHKGPTIQGQGGPLAVTNDADALGDDADLAHSFEKAWRIFGNLVYNGRLTVNFSDPNWPVDVMLTVESITEDITATRHSG